MRDRFEEALLAIFGHTNPEPYQCINLDEDGGFGVLDVAEQDIQGDSESSEAEAAAGEENDVDE